MPLDPIVMQRRHAEVGRIRLGVKIPGKNRRGEDVLRPEKLDRFRFTSPDAGLVEAVAALYGGEAKPWQNGSLSEHEVITDATSIPVYVLRGAFSQWFEAWTAAGCAHRCTGTEDHTDPQNVKPCREDDPNHIAAIEKPTTRLSVMLTELDSLGAWRLETKGWNAAAELPSMAELAGLVGDLVPARLYLATRRKVIKVNGKPQTSIFVVPGLDLQVTKARLAEIAGGVASAAPQIEGPASGMRPAAEISAAPSFDEDDATDALADTTTVDEVSALWRRLGSHGMLTDEWKARLTARAQEIDPIPVRTAEPGEPLPDLPPSAHVDPDSTPLDEPIDAEVVDDPVAADAAWSRAVAVAGSKQIGNTELLRMWGEWSGGKDTADGTAADFEAFAAHLARSGS